MVPLGIVASRCRASLAVARSGYDTPTQHVELIATEDKALAAVCWAVKQATTASSSLDTFRAVTMVCFKVAIWVFMEATVAQV